MTIEWHDAIEEPPVKGEFVWLYAGIGTNNDGTPCNKVGLAYLSPNDDMWYSVPTANGMIYTNPKAWAKLQIPSHPIKQWINRPENEMSE